MPQSRCFTMVVPSSRPTSCASLMEADCCTTLTMSSRHPTGVLRNFCLRRPNAQSGANLVWPTSMKLISMCVLRPAMTRHKKYCITNLCGIVVYYVNSLNFMLVLTYSHSAHYSCRHGGITWTLQDCGQKRNGAAER